MVEYDEKLKFKIDKFTPKNELIKGRKDKWWMAEKSTVYQSVYAEVSALYARYNFFFKDRLLNEAVYMSKFPMWYGGIITGNRGTDSHRLNKNCTASAIDTLTSMMAKQDIGISVVTTDGDYNLQKQAEDLGRYLDGLKQKENLLEKMLDCQLESSKNYNGVMQLVERKDHCVGYVPIKAYELVMNIDDTFHGDPETIHIVRYHNRYDLCKEYPEYIKEIMAATGEYSWFLWERLSKQDDEMVVTVESYSRFAARHTFCVDTVCLFEKELKLKDASGNISFPLAVLRYKSSGKKWWGIGAIEQVRTIQWALDSTYRDMEIMKRYTLVPRLLMPRTAQIEKNFINNDKRLPIIDYSTDQIPSLLQVNLPAELWQFIQYHENSIYSILGVSQLMAQSEKPAGLDSGKALDSFYDIQNDRFEDHGRCWENFMEEIADKTIRYQSTFDEADKAYTFYVGKNIKRQIKFSDVDLTKEAYQIKKVAVSDMPKSIEGKMQTVQWFLQTGMMDKTTAMQLFQLPDVDQYMDMENAQIKYIMRQMSDIADGEDVIFETWQDPNLCATIARKSYAHFSLHGLSEDKLTAIKLYIQSIEKEMLQKQAVMTIVNQEMLQDQQQAILQNKGTNPSFATASGKAIAPEPSDISTKMAMGAYTT